MNAVEEFSRPYEFGGTVARLVGGTDVAPSPRRQSLDDIQTSRKLLRLPELLDRKPPPYLVRGLIVEESLVAIFGPPGSAKTFLALDIALRIAYGEPWLGREVKTGPVVYVAGEGIGGLSKRVKAWLIRNGKEGQDAPFLVWPEPVSLIDNEAVAAFLAEITAEFINPQGIVFDTLARNFIGGDENSAKDMGLAIASADHIRRTLSATVAIVHHAPKDPSKGLRGSTALPGAMDTTIEVTKDGALVTVRVDKQKDDDPGAPIFFDLTVMPLPDAEDGTPVSSCVLVPSETPPTEAPRKLSPNQQTTLDLLRDAGAAGLTNADWYEAAVDQGIAAKRKASFYDTRKQLERMSKIREEGGRWIAT